MTHTRTFTTRRSTMLLVSLAVAALVAFLAAAPTIAQTRRTTCPQTHGAHPKSKTRTCSKSSHADKTGKHLAKSRRHRAKPTVSHKRVRKPSSKKTSSGTSLAPACEDGSSPTDTGEGTYECEDGSAPLCEDGSQPTLSESGDTLLCEAGTSGYSTFEEEPGEGEEETE